MALFQDPLTALWVVLLFIGLQQLEGHIVAPQIFGHALRINPLIVIIALLFGDAIYGIIGALIALPVAAVLRETILYLRRHVVLEPWRPRRRHRPDPAVPPRAACGRPAGSSGIGVCGAGCGAWCRDAGAAAVAARWGPARKLRGAKR